MIIIKVSGGLGNQLFQYSLGRYLADKYNTEIKIDLQVDIAMSNFTPRSFGLSKFNINTKFANEQEIKRFRYFTKGILSRIERKLVQKIPLLNKRMIVEKPFSLLKDNHLIDNCYYDGYWQSAYYFESIENVLKKELNFNIDLNKANLYILNEIRKKQSVSIHIRRGDYISVKANSSIYSVCNITYYRAAISFFKQKLLNPVFYVFSDDVIWAKENFKGDLFNFVTGNDNNPHADMYLMSECKHQIIANSTFSWWGAWLNKNPDKIVVAPQKWFIKDISIQYLVPKDWIRL